MHKAAFRKFDAWMQGDNDLHHFLHRVRLLSRRKVCTQAGLVFDLRNRTALPCVFDRRRRRLKSAEDAPVDGRVRPQLLLQPSVHRRDLPARNLPTERFFHHSGDPVRRLLIRRNKALVQATLLSSLAAELREKDSEFVLP